MEHIEATKARPYGNKTQSFLQIAWEGIVKHQAALFVVIQLLSEVSKNAIISVYLGHKRYFIQAF